MSNIRAAMSQFINAAAVSEAPVRGPIDRIEEVEVEGKTKHVLFLVGHPKGLPLNVTNANLLADALGDETDNWIGTEIELYKDRTTFKGKQVDCVRVKLCK